MNLWIGRDNPIIPEDMEPQALFTTTSITQRINGNNRIDKEFEMKVCNEPETIKISDCDPKKQTCVLTNHGIVTDVIFK